MLAWDSAVWGSILVQPVLVVYSAHWQVQDHQFGSFHHWQVEPAVSKIAASSVDSAEHA